jgi:hypothetical protein
MTQKEIKENMPQLPLQTDYDGSTVTDDMGEHVLKCQSEHYTSVVDNYMQHAIVHAINNTYGKKINPESVPDMYNALTLIELNLMGSIDETVTAKTIRDILKNATL